jgi:hypothetical protein
VGKINILYFFGPFKILHAWLHESIHDRCNNSAGTVCVRAAGGRALVFRISSARDCAASEQESKQPSTSMCKCNRKWQQSIHPSIRGRDAVIVVKICAQVSHPAETETRRQGGGVDVMLRFLRPPGEANPAHVLSAALSFLAITTRCMVGWLVVALAQRFSVSPHPPSIPRRPVLFLPARCRSAG